MCLHSNVHVNGQMAEIKKPEPGIFKRLEKKKKTFDSSLGLAFGNSGE